jgi:hypothetical protein
LQTATTTLIKGILAALPVQPSEISNLVGPMVEVSKVDEDTLDFTITNQVHRSTWPLLPP